MDTASSPPEYGSLDLHPFLPDGPPDLPLLVDRERIWTLSALARAVDEAAAELPDRGVAPGMLHPVRIHPDARGVITLLALWRLGAVPVPLNPRLTGTEREEAGRRLVSAGKEEGLPEGTAVVLWTSGTAGRPRGVALSVANLRTSAEAAAERLALGPGDVWLASLSPAHVGGLALITRSLLLGSTLVVPGSVTPDQLPGLLRGQDPIPPVTHLSLVPTQLLRLLDRWGDAPPPGSLRLVLVGGAHASVELVRRALDRGWPLALTYGMTEMSSQVATATPAEVRDDPEGVGLPLPGVDVGIGEGGEILARGPTRALGYVGGRKPLADREGWYHTGDLGEVDSSGRLRVTGRLTDRIISGGVTVDALEVEAVLRSHPEVRDACVVGLPDPEWGERVAAAVVPATDRVREAGATLPARVEEWCRKHLTGAKVPRRWVVLPALPLNANGKVDRAAVQAALGEG